MFFIDIKEVKADHWLGVRVATNPAKIVHTFCQLCLNLRDKLKMRMEYTKW